MKATHIKKVVYFDGVKKFCQTSDGIFHQIFSSPFLFPRSNTFLSTSIQIRGLLSLFPECKELSHMYTVTLAEVSLVYVILIFRFLDRTGRIKAFVLGDIERSVKYGLSRFCFFHWSCRLLKIFPVEDSFRVLALFPDKLVCFSTYTGCQIRAVLLLPASKEDVTNKSATKKNL